MAKWIKNTDIAGKTWLGQFIDVGSFYQIDTNENKRWSSNSSLISDISSGKAKVSTCGSDSGIINDVITATHYLQTTIPIYDTTPITLETNKKAKIECIDLRTATLIAGGFSFDGNTFSLSQNAQINWVGLKTLESVLTWPVNITTKGDNQYSLEQADLDTFMGTGLAAKQAHLDSGRALKIQVNAAADQAALDAVVDNR